MPKTKKESFVYSLMMCAFMVSCMSFYNIAVHTGNISAETFLLTAKGIIPGFIVAFICDWFIVSRPAKAIAFKIIKPEDRPIKKILVISLSMVLGMVLCMSLYGAISNFGINSHLIFAYIQAILTNIIMALPLQILVAGPIIRFIFKKIYPQT